MKNLEVLSKQELTETNGGSYGGEDVSCPEMIAVLEALTSLYLVF